MKSSDAIADDPFRRQTAFHEAAHVVTAWMFGMGETIHYIDMRGDEVNKAFVRMTGLNAMGVLYREKDPGHGYPEHAIAVAKSQMVYLLAGHAAEGRLAEDPEWLEHHLELGEWEDRAVGDVYRADEIAGAIHRDPRESRELLVQMSVWTDEALSHSGFWQAVVDLADTLHQASDCVMADEAISVIEGAWPTNGLPLWSMGNVWRDRFAAAGPYLASLSFERWEEIGNDDTEPTAF